MAESSPSCERVLVICGTRPEGIKMAPLVVALKQQADLEVKLCVTGQHREMLDQVLALFDLVPDFDLNVMRPGQDLTGVTSAILTGLRDLFATYRPDRILVHGDTNTTFSAAIAAFYASIPVSHVEAGLRTGNIHSPWPEEANRKLTSVVTDRHYAPTPWAKQNLLAEQVPESAIVVTGNTVIDALLMTVARLDADADFRHSVEAQFPFLDDKRRLILVTGHRRESFGDGFVNICKALAKLAERDDVQIVYPVHLNPNVQQPVNRWLADNPRIHLIAPLDYLPFVYLMSRCHHIITDSGGVQEEAPSLGKPVLVMRNTTERPEAVEAGTVKLVGTVALQIIEASTHLLEDAAHYQRMSVANNPYGDGTACRAIVDDLLS